jgi:hypothetical protein
VLKEQPASRELLELQVLPEPQVLKGYKEQ